MCPVIIRVSSSYFEADTSRYRMGITECTLVESLRRQTDKDFLIVPDISPMDPCYTRRISLFNQCGAIVLQHVLDENPPKTPHIEIFVDDDCFLHAEFVASVKKVPVTEKNRRIIAPNGYLFIDCRLETWTDRSDVVEVTQFVETDRRIREAVRFTKSHCWIHVRHKHNSTVLFNHRPGLQVSGVLNWPGWQPNIVQRYCQMQIKEATAQGAELYPTRSKSVVYAHNSARGRRKR